MYSFSKTLSTAAICLFASLALDAGAANYNGPIARLWSDTSTSLPSGFTRGNAAWITPSAAPENWVSLSRASSVVATAMKAADFGSGAFESVFLRTSPAPGGLENMDSLNIQDTRFDAPPNQVRSLTVWNSGGTDLVTLSMGGTSSTLRVLDATMTGIAAASVIGRHGIELTTGTVYVYNTATNSFQPVQDAVLEISAN